MGVEQDHTKPGTHLEDDATERKTDRDRGALGGTWAAVEERLTSLGNGHICGGLREQGISCGDLSALSNKYTQYMATARLNLLSLEEFRSRYAEEKPYFEYWFGEAVQKTVPTVSHVLLVSILLAVLKQAGYKSGPELELRIDPEWQPKADVAAWTRIEGPYPTQPIDVVVEVVSPDDRMQRVISKCRNYERIGTRSIFVMDPESRDAWVWSSTTKNLERISMMTLPNGKQIVVEELWAELERQLRND